MLTVLTLVVVAVVQSLDGGGCEPDVCSPSGASLLHKVSRSRSQYQQHILYLVSHFVVPKWSLY